MSESTTKQWWSAAYTGTYRYTLHGQMGILIGLTEMQSEHPLQVKMNDWIGHSSS